MKCVNYENALKLLTSQGKFHIDLGLERVSKVLNLLGNPHKDLKCIHVAGTNGKGSVCAIIETILRNNGLRTGLFTSPHIFSYCERIKIDGKSIEEEVFAKKIFEVQDLSKKHKIHLTEFEILTVCAFCYFKENKTDVVVLETGLGGRLDATNVIEKNVCAVITHIDFDHTERLGGTIEKIAFEKAGIIKKDCPVVVSAKNSGYDVIKKFADNNLVLAEQFESENLSLKGSYQRENLALAVSAVRIALPKISDEEISKSLPFVKHSCRFEYFADGNLIVDGAHNPNGARALRKSLDEYYPNVKLRFVFGCLRNKNYATMIAELLQDGDEIEFYHFNNPNACTFEELQAVCPYPAKTFNGLKPQDDVLTIICGSLYMINEIIRVSA